MGPRTRPGDGPLTIIPVLQTRKQRVESSRSLSATRLCSHSTPSIRRLGNLKANSSRDGRQGCRGAWSSPREVGLGTAAARTSGLEQALGPSREKGPLGGRAVGCSRLPLGMGEKRETDLSGGFPGVPSQPGGLCGSLR